MPTLRLSMSEANARLYPIRKRLTTIGRGLDNDVVLNDPVLGETHAHLLFDGRDFHLAVLDRQAESLVNGKRRRTHRLRHEDVIRLGNCELVFSAFEEASREQDLFEERTSFRKASATSDSYRTLYQFSSRLLGNYELSDLLEALMDAVVEITAAERGFLILVESEGPQIKVARNLRRENVADAVTQLSDSIVKKVIDTRKPLVVSDALKDAEWKNAMSVMSLQLSSVLCVPLLERGNLIGVLYVGNNSVAHLFDESHLEILTIFAAQASLIVRNALLLNELRLDNQLLSERLNSLRFGEIIGACPAMNELFRRLQKVATTDISVLITGETGTGKELIARELHGRSSRQSGPFVTINCGAIPENLLESELFGHVRGAFTGAVTNKLGKFHAADGGTLFLDEIGELPLNLQVKLLRALQEKSIVRVGETRPEAVDIRILAATHRNLEAEIKAGRFREDLYYRLNVVNLHLPALRERGEDIPVIAKFLLRRYSEEFGGRVKGFSPNALIAIRKYSWPGNIRQLENHLKKACVLAEKALLEPEDLGLTPETLPEILPLAEAKERFQRDYINQILELNNGNRTKTARDLGVDPRTIFRHLEKEDGDSESPIGT
jgi:transcriptional regulator with GAF, ATPase, and Fis domain